MHRSASLSGKRDGSGKTHRVRLTARTKTDLLAKIRDAQHDDGLASMAEADLDALACDLDAAAAGYPAAGRPGGGAAADLARRGGRLAAGAADWGEWGTAGRA